MPPAPGLFSTMNDWPIDLEKLSARTRAMMSVAEPGVNATMILTGFEGYDCAAASPANAASARQASDRTSVIGDPSSRIPDSRTYPP
jgi:hypothetical protein